MNARISKRRIRNMFNKGNILEIDNMSYETLVFVTLDLTPFELDEILSISGAVYSVIGYSDSIRISLNKDKLLELILKGNFQ